MTQDDSRPNRGSRLSMISGGIAVTLLGLSALVWTFSDTDGRPAGTPQDLLTLDEREDLNVLFILVDTLRADRLGTYGYERNTSPRIDALADTGIRFAHHVSQSSWTKCSMASMWTGLYPVRTGVLRHQHAVSEEALMPAEILLDEGFRTAAIWRNSWIAPNFGFSQGFELYHNPKPLPVPNEVRRDNPSILVSGDDSDVIHSAFEFMRAHRNERWFLYLHMMDVHQYAYPEETARFGSKYSDSYDNSVLWTDSLVGHLLDELTRLELRDRTIIVFTSDHGEAFGEHGGGGHARNVYGEVTETPLVLGLPFRLDSGIVVEDRSENVDLWPTVLELMGMPPLEDPDGHSLIPEIVAAGGGAPIVGDGNDGLAFAQLDLTWGRSQVSPDPMIAVNYGKWRLIHRPRAPKRSRLYDKSVDPDEQQNLIAEYPEIYEELTAKIDEYLESRPAPWGDETPSLEIDEMQLRQLRAIGYGVQ